MAGLKGQVSMKFCAFIVNSRLSLVNPQETARLLRLIISSDKPFPLWESYGAPHARLCTTRPRNEIHRHIDRCLRQTSSPKRRRANGKWLWRFQATMTIRRVGLISKLPKCSK